MSLVVGKYEHVSTQNSDQYLKKLGASFLLRKKVANRVEQPVVDICQEDDGLWTIRTTADLTTTTYQFRSGEPFKEKTSDGRTNLVEVTVENEAAVVTILETGENEDDPCMSTVISFTEDGMCQKSEVIGDNIQCVQMFRRIST